MHNSTNIPNSSTNRTSDQHASHSTTQRRKAPSAPPDPAACPIAQLVQLAASAGVEFRLQGCEVLLSNVDNLAPYCRAALCARGDELWSHLGGIPLSTVSGLLDTYDVAIAYPRTPDIARQVVDEILADARANMPTELRGQLRPWVGCDTETAADPGQELRPPIKLKKDGHPAKIQTPLKETAGLDPHRSHIRLVQFYGGGKRVLVFDTHLLPFALLEPLLTGGTLITHNVGFDLRFLLNAGADIETIQFEDTMQAAGLLLGAGNRSLDNVLLEMLGVVLAKGLQRSPWHARRLSAAQITYAGADAVAAYKVWPILRQRLLATGRGPAYVLQRDVTRPAVRMVERGITLDVTAHAALSEDWERQHTEAVHAFEQTAQRSVPDTPDETRDYLIKILPPATLAQWNVTKKTGALSIRAADLRRVGHLPGVRELLEVQQYVKLRNSFGASLVEKISAKTGRLHPGYNIASAKTGRASSNNPNVQQTPREDKAAGFRACLIARPGYLLIVCDYATMELRAAAVISGDQRMLADFAEGIDLHRQLAATVLGIPYDAVTRAQRNAVKGVSFGTIFGAGPRGIAATVWSNYGIELSYDDAARALHVFFERYPTFAAWMRQHHTECVLTGVIKIGQLGRVIEAAWETPKAQAKAHAEPDEDSELDQDDDYDPYADDAVWSTPRPDFADQPILGAALKYTLCCNSPIQGACADATMLALLNTDKALRVAGIDGGPVLCIHDEIVLEVAEHQVEQASAILQTEMRNAFAQTFPNASLRGVVECHGGRTWAAAKPG
jgi:DNA polymerase I-like protein with 3'-5' exonuclease and polymerase domains